MKMIPLLMGPKAVPIIVTALGCTAVLVNRNRKKPRGMTSERQAIFEAALVSLKDPVRLRTLADVFEKEGLLEKAKLLRQRAELAGASPEKKLERREIFRKAMRSKNPEAVAAMAVAFDKMGATGAAFNLRKYAAALKQLGPAASQPLPEPEGDVVEAAGEQQEGNSGDD